jgi:hypothetical protein
VGRVAIEVVDAGLVAARDGALSAVSPGIALLDASGLAIGREAAAQARVKPVHAFDRYWSDLSTDPLPRQLPEARSRADLAYRHLLQFWAEVAGPGAEALFVLPATMRPAEAGLLGGIAAAAGIPAAGFVDLAVAACAPLAACETVLHLDLQLHHAVLTELGGEERLHRRRVEVAPRVGLRALHSAWAQLVSEAMVRRTRFDPLHQAATEQQLYDRLPGWIESLAGAENVEAEVESNAGTFGVSLRREQFVLAVEAYYAQLSDLMAAVRRAGEPATVVLSARAAALPALVERCAAMPDADVVTLPEGAAAHAALVHWTAAAAGGSTTLSTALPRAVAPERRRVAPAGRGGGKTPTHVVFGGRAWAIGAEPLKIGVAPGQGRTLALDGPLAGVSRSHCTVVAEDGRVQVLDHSRYGTWLNGARVTSRAGLAAGDRLRLGTPGVLLELVAAG